MATVFKWLFWFFGIALLAFGIVLAFSGGLEGFAVLAGGLCTFGVGIALHLLADIQLRVKLLYSELEQKKRENTGSSEEETE